MNLSQAKKEAERIDKTLRGDHRLWIQEHPKTGVCAVKHGPGRKGMKQAYKAGFKVHEALRGHAGAMPV